MKRKLDINSIALPVLIAVAALLRFYGLGRMGLWTDESVSWQQSSGSFMDTLASVWSDNHVPLYHFILNFSIRLLGDSEAALRIPSALFGILAVWLVYKLGSVLWDREMGLMAALLTTFSGMFIGYSQEARMYTLLACTAMYFVLTTIHATRDPSSKRLVLNTLAGILLLYTHVYGSFVFAGINLFVIAALLLRKSWIQVSPKGWLGAQAITIFFFLPWAFNLLTKGNEIHHSGFWIEEFTTLFVLKQLAIIAGGVPAFIALSLLCLVAILSLPPVNFAPTIQPSSGSKTSRFGAAIAADWRTGLILTWLFSSLVLGILASIAMGQNILLYRYLFGSFPAFLLLAALGLRKLQNSSRLLPLALSITMICFAPVLLCTLCYPIVSDGSTMNSWLRQVLLDRDPVFAAAGFYSQPRSEAREMISSVRQQLQDGDQIFAAGDQGALFEYYLRDIKNDYYLDIDSEEITRRGPKFDRFWILNTEKYPPGAWELSVQMPVTHELINYAEYPGYRAYLFQRKSDSLRE